MSKTLRWLGFVLFFGALGCDRKAMSDSENINVFLERSEEEVRTALELAKERAKSEGKLVLLEFVAPWCSDCREVNKLCKEEPVKSILREKYILVPINVGRFDKHKTLIKEHDIKVIAAFVVLDSEGRRIAKTTLEPITKKGSLTAGDLADWLRSPV